LNGHAAPFPRRATSDVPGFWVAGGIKRRHTLEAATPERLSTAWPGAARSCNWTPRPDVHLATRIWSSAMATEAGVYKPTAERVARAILDAEAASVATNLESPSTWPTWRGSRTPVAIGLERLPADPGAAATIVAALESAITVAFPETEAIIGVAESGLYWSSLVSRQLGLPHGFVRKSPSRSAPPQRIEARFANGAKLLLVDDLAASGRTFEACAKALRTHLQATVVGCHVVLRVSQRECHERESRLGLRIRALATMEDVLREVVRRDRLDVRAAGEVQRFYTRPEAHDWDTTALLHDAGTLIS
jgi:orotate phosphoribosyltransferase